MYIIFTLKNKHVYIHTYYIYIYAHTYAHAYAYMCICTPTNSSHMLVLDLQIISTCFSIVPSCTDICPWDFRLVPDCTW